VSNPSNVSKQKWNAAHYSQVKVSVKPEIADAFSAACAANAASQARVLSDFMAEYSRIPAEKTNTRLNSRKARRSAVKAVTAQLADILAAEESYRDNVPENLQGSKWHEASEASISVICEALDLMSEIY